MSVTHVATTPKGLKAHWENIMHNYLAKEITKITITSTIDDMGQIVGVDETQSTIFGAISPVGQKTVTEAPGMWIEGDLVLYLMAEDSFEIEQSDAYTTIKYYIEYESRRYMTEKVTTAYDAGVAVVCKYRLKKIDG